MPDFIEHFEPLAQNYDVLLCDVWGVIHNGVTAFAPACDALLRFRERGGTAILITNAPRPGDSVARILDRLAVPRQAYDAITSSGDTTRGIVASRRGQRVFHLGPAARRADLRRSRSSLSRRSTPPITWCARACSTTPSRRRRPTATCSLRCGRAPCSWSAPIPTSWSSAATTLVYCAGALADAYVALGGEVLYCGKPHPPIYQAALAAAAAARGGAAVPLKRVLAVGDSVRTDLKGAAAIGIDSVFVTSGIHAEEYGGRHTPDSEALDGIFAAGGVTPIAVTRGLKW